MERETDYRETGEMMKISFKNIRSILQEIGLEELRLRQKYVIETNHTITREM